MKFKAKGSPVVEAVQYTGDNKKEIEELLGVLVSKLNRVEILVQIKYERPVKSRTLDWFVKIEDGSFVVLNRDQFNALYKPVED